MFVVVAVYAIDVIGVVDAVDDVAVGVDAAVDLALCSSSMDLNFERISFSLFAKQIRCEPLHSHRTKFQHRSRLK